MYQNNTLKRTRSLKINGGHSRWKTRIASWKKDDKELWVIKRLPWVYFSFFRQVRRRVLILFQVVSLK